MAPHSKNHAVDGLMIYGVLVSVVCFIDFQAAYDYGA